MKLFLSKPRGFCAGVVRAIETVEKALELWGPPIYVKHEIVHNRHVVEELKGKGAIFIEDLDDVPKGARLIYSAHGVSPAVRDHARSRGLIEIDATCGLVTKVHSAVKRYAQKGYQIILIGHRNHVEIIGTAGEHLGHHMEIRGVGIINVEKLFGIRAVRLQKRIEVEVRLEAMAKELPVVGYLRTIPGIGLLTATALLAFIGDIHRFPSGRHLASYLGLTPREFSSGLKRNLGRISKRGDGYLRTLLIHGARSVLLHARTKQPDRLREWANKLAQTHVHNKAAVAVANKMARIVWAVWSRLTPFTEIQKAA